VSGDEVVKALPTAVTMGDPAGIGGEITLKAWRDHRHMIAPFFVIDDPERLERLAKRLGFAVPVKSIEAPGETAAVYPHALPVLPERLAVPSEPGRLDPANGPAVRRSIERAVALTRTGIAGAVVTNPIHKLGLSQAGFEYPGHTEFLAALAGIDSEPVMMLTAEALSVVAITRHVSVRRALDLLTTDLIVETALITDTALKQDFGIRNPRLAFAGLNPHAGEGGLMGAEEISIIEPALRQLRAAGIQVSGPHPSDTLFNPRARAGYDAALCMYHDQALIPIKTIAFDSAVNVTLGLPFIRTSPDHGTAFDIAGTGTADESSLVSALTLTGRMVRNRAHWRQESGQAHAATPAGAAAS
jgi:4-hydroxythreonine-4-phosphate dehydrogenase